jgi:serine/threonine-protein kinase
MAESPELIGKYKIIGLLARGGMGAVYKAVHPTLNRTVILKKLTVRGNPQFIERFKREAKIMMDFKHDNIVTVYDHFKEGNSYYIVLEYVDGFSLDELIKRERALPSVLAMYIFLEICEALKYAHDTGVIHRDIKPANVLISRSGQVKLVDFGIAAYEEEEEGSEALTAHGMTLGTPSYMPPEQFEDTKSVDKCADIYAMGVVLYEMVTGKKPFPGNFAPDTINMIQKGRYIRVLRLNPKLDKLIARLTAKMIKPKKQQRYQDLAPVIKLLRKRLKRDDIAEAEEHLVACMTGKPFQAKPRRGRKTKRFLAAALAFAVLAAGPAYWLFDSGYYHEWLDPGEWGKFDVSVLRPKSVEDAMPVSVQLFSESGGDVKRIGGLALPGFWNGLYDRCDAVLSRLKVAKARKAALGPRTDMVYVKPGSYRLKIQSGNKLLWDSYYLEPLVVQRQGGKEGGLRLSYSLGEPLPKAVTFRFDIVDERLRQRLGDKCRILMASASGAWTDAEEFPLEERISGRVFRVRLTADGYLSKEFSIRVEPGQTEVAIQAAMVAEGVPLAVKTNMASAAFTLNGKKAVLSGDAQRAMKDLSLTRDKPLSLRLPPGSYTLEAGSGKKKASVSVRLVPGESAAVEIFQPSGSKDIELRQSAE